MFELINIKKVYKGVPVFNDFNLKINFSDRIGIWGFNGVGKTTLLQILGGIVKPDNPEGFNVDKTNKNKIGFIFQNPIHSLFPWFTSLKNIQIQLNYTKHEAKDYLISFNFPIEFHNKLPNQLSGGYAQRLAWAIALNNRNTFILLDEPFSKQDQENCDYLAKKLINNAYESQTGFVLISHDPIKIVQCCDQIILFENTRVGAQIKEIIVNQIDVEQRRNLTIIKNLPILNKLF